MFLLITEFLFDLIITLKLLLLFKLIFLEL